MDYAFVELTVIFAGNEANLAEFQDNQIGLMANLLNDLIRMTYLRLNINGQILYGLVGEIDNGF